MLDAFKTVASWGPFPFVVEGNGKKWATDGHRLVIAPSPVAGDEIPRRVRAPKDTDFTKLPESRSFANLYPNPSADHTFTLDDPRAIVRFCDDALRAQREENAPLVTAWREQIAQARARKQSYEAQRLRKEGAPKPRTSGKIGLPSAGGALMITGYRDDRNTAISAVSWVKPIDWAGIDLRYLRDALRAVPRGVKPTLQVSSDGREPFMLRAGDVTTLIMPVRL